MRIDTMDIFGGIFGQIFLAGIVFLSAVFIGGTLGFIAEVIGYMDLSNIGSGYVWSEVFRDGPIYFLFQLEWLMVKVIMLVITILFAMFGESLSLKLWGTLCITESLCVMLALNHDIPFSESMGAWIAWVILGIMTITGLWLIQRARNNWWALQMEELKAENAMARLEREIQEQ